MSCGKKEWDSGQLRKYDLNLEQIPRLHYRDVKVDELMKANQPVLIVDSSLVKPAVEKWTLEYLEKNLSRGSHTVFLSKNHKFKYFDDKKILSRSNPKGVEFTPPTKRIEMKIGDFMKRLKDWKRGDEKLVLQKMFKKGGIVL